MMIKCIIMAIMNSRTFVLHERAALPHVGLEEVPHCRPGRPVRAEQVNAVDGNAKLDHPASRLKLRRGSVGHERPFDGVADGALVARRDVISELRLARREQRNTPGLHGI